MYLQVAWCYLKLLLLLLLWIFLESDVKAHIVYSHHKLLEISSSCNNLAFDYI